MAYTYVHRLTCLLFLFLFGATASLSAQQLALKTNALYWATSTPNFGVEVGVARHLSVSATVGYNSWHFSGKRSLKHTLFSPEVRYWFTRPMEAHSVGFYLQTGKFNLRNAPFFSDESLVYRGSFWGGGFSYSYQWALGKRFGIEAQMGVGYLQIPYTLYQRVDCCMERISSHRRNYLGPTRLAVNLIYLIH